MDRRSYRFRIRLWCWLVFLLPLGAPAQEPSQLFVIGDSLSDTGNAAGTIDALAGLFTFDRTGQYTVGLCSIRDPYLSTCEDIFYEKSRVSDAAVAVEHLAAGLHVGELFPSFHLLPFVGVPRPDGFGSNYAVASAKARTGGRVDLATQVAALVVDRLGQNGLPTDALYVFAIGGNDTVDAAQAAIELASGEEPDERPKEIIDGAVNAIAANVERLIGLGARDFLVLNVPNIGAFPAVRNTGVEGISPQWVSSVATLLAGTFNARLFWELRQIQQRHPSARVELFDLYTAFEIVRARAFFSGSNVKDACFDSDAYGETGTRIFHEDCAPPAPGLAPDFSGFVFWDELHPTGNVHAAIGKRLLDAVRNVRDGG